MAADSVLRWAPLVTVAVWLSIAGYLVRTQRHRTWTERFFLGMALCVAAYGLSDVLFFQIAWPGPAGLDPATLAEANVLASASVISIMLVGLFLCLYGVSLASRFRRGMLALVIPLAFFVAVIPVALFASFEATAGVGSPVEPVYSTTWLYPWLSFTSALWLLGILGVTKAFLEIRALNRTLANRIGLILLGLAIAVLAGAATNAMVAINAVQAPPLFSSFLSIPGILIFFAVRPSTYTSLNDALLRRKAASYEIKGAFLTFSDGTLIGSQTAPGEDMIDADSFSATLDVISNFMRTSFPTLRGRWLKSIRHGDYTLVIERGQFVSVTLIISGMENDQLRREMIGQLDAFEAANGRRLEKWRGVSEDAVGVDRMLTSLLQGGRGTRAQA